MYNQVTAMQCSEQRGLRQNPSTGLRGVSKRFHNKNCPQWKASQSVQSSTHLPDTTQVVRNAMPHEDQLSLDRRIYKIRKIEINKRRQETNRNQIDEIIKCESRVIIQGGNVFRENTQQQLQTWTTTGYYNHVPTRKNYEVGNRNVVQEHEWSMDVQENLIGPISGVNSLNNDVISQNRQIGQHNNIWHTKSRKWKRRGTH